MQAQRQCGANTENVCCNPTPGINEGDCESNNKEFFDNAKTAMLFKV